MGSHPLNLAIRFLLELMALGSVGLWGWKQFDTWFRFIPAFGIPIALALIWGIFTVPDDPSRSGSAPVVTPGYIKLIIELVIFGFAAWTIKDMGWLRWSIIWSSIVFIHYIISYDRVVWLLGK